MADLQADDVRLGAQASLYDLSAAVPPFELVSADVGVLFSPNERRPISVNNRQQHATNQPQQ